MKHLRRHLPIGLVALALASLTACGGGGGGSGSDAGNNTSTVNGIAATGLAIDNGRVSLKCAIGATSMVNTLADGSFTVDISRVTLPCIARVDYTDTSTGKAAKLHSLVKVSGNLNITPVTDMLVANLSTNGVAADTYDKFEANEVRAYSDERVRTATQLVKTYLKSKGIDTTHLPDDVIGTKFVATHGSRKGDDHDRVLDDIKEKFHAEGKDLHEAEDEMESGHESRGLGTSTGLPGDAGAGKIAYDTSCRSCHGPRISDAINASNTMRAIQKNKGGMGALASTITVVTADNIATYLANGTSGGNSVALKTQSITFASPGNQVMGNTAPVLVATATSGLPVTITSTTVAVCTVSGTTLTLVAPGSCSLSASQSGNTTYTAATAVSNTFTVASASGVVLPAQTITFVSPGAQTMGVTPPNLSASASSGLQVTLTSSTAGVCTVSGNTLTLVAPGNCTVTAQQAGNANFAAAANVARTFAVNNPAVVNSAVNGKTLYASCSGCHGAAAGGGLNVLAGANNPSVLQSAISSNMGGMGMFYSLTGQNLADIAAYLATPTI